MPHVERLARLIRARALTRAAFAPYGDVIAAPAGLAGGAVDGGTIDGGASNDAMINNGTARRFDDLTRLDVGDSGGEACLAIFRCGAEAHAPPLRLTMFERHCLGSQSFVPMGRGRCLAIVAGAADAPDEEAIRAFIVEPGQGVTLRRGVWHHPLITLGAADILVIERRGGAVDCEIVALAGHFVVTL